MRSMTLVEKILASKSNKTTVRPGDYVEAEVDRILVSDAAYRSIQAFYELGVKKVYAPEFPPSGW